MTFQASELSQKAAQVAAEAWVNRFVDAMASVSLPNVKSLFHEESYWRDCVAVTRQIQTAEGPDQIQSLIAKMEPTDRPHDIRHLGKARQENGIIIGEFSFRTAVFKGTAVFRLRDGKCFLLASFAEGLVSPILKGDDPYVDTNTVIIGAGHAGLSLAACLKNLGVPAVIYDAQDLPGDSWRHRYNALKLHDPTKFNHLPFQPFPEDWPEYTTKDKLADFLTEYAKTQDLNVVPQTRCIDAKQVKGTWSVTLETAGYEWEVTCRNFVMATGRFGKPHIPTFDGSEKFSGPIFHASQFKDGAEYAGQRVAVVGTGNTAFDIALDLAKNGADVTMIQRSPICLASQETFAELLYRSFPDGVGRNEFPNAIERHLFSIPVNLFLKGAAVAWQKSCEMDAKMHASLTAAGLMLSSGYKDTGIFGQVHLGATGFVIDQGTAQWIVDGRIAIQTGNVKYMTESCIQLDTGTEIDVDVVICATGFEPFTTIMSDVLGEDLAAQVGPVWGVGSGSSNDPGPWTGEQRNVWSPTPLNGLWIHGGSLGFSRFYSHLLALQIASKTNSTTTLN